MTGYQKQQGCTGVLATPRILPAEVFVKQGLLLLSSTASLLNTEKSSLAKAWKSTRVQLQQAKAEDLSKVQSCLTCSYETSDHAVLLPKHFTTPHHC